MGWLSNYGAFAGLSHGSKTPCQDYACSLERNGVTAIALSDGCGSSPFSQYGSERTASTLLELLTGRFDELIKLGALELRKTIIDEIVGGLERLVIEKRDLVQAYRESNPIKSNESITRLGEQGFAFSLFHATALFAAEKEGISILGRVGDGVLGALVDGKMKIVLEEEKDEEKNGTFYPYNIYSLAKNNPDWYASKCFAVLKVRQPIEGIVLTSDGVDALFDKRVPFECKYAKGISGIFDGISEFNDFSLSQDFLKEQVLPALVTRSSTRDDCSIALMLQRGSKIEEFVTKNYPRPKKEEGSVHLSPILSSAKVMPEEKERTSEPLVPFSSSSSLPSKDNPLEEKKVDSSEASASPEETASRKSSSTSWEEENTVLTKPGEEGTKRPEETWLSQKRSDPKEKPVSKPLDAEKTTKVETPSEAFSADQKPLKAMPMLETVKEKKKGKVFWLRGKRKLVRVIYRKNHE